MISGRTMNKECVAKNGQWWAYSFRPVNDLVRHQKVARRHFLLETTHGRESDYASHAELSQRRDVGSGVDFVRSDFMMQAVPREEGHIQRRSAGKSGGSTARGERVRGGAAGMGEDGDWRRRRTPWCGESRMRQWKLGDWREVRERGKTCAAYDGYLDSACGDWLAACF